MGQDPICLSATSADNPLMTCLVGIPYGPKDLSAKLLEITEQTYREGASKGQSMLQHRFNMECNIADIDGNKARRAAQYCERCMTKNS
ncbi:hypothetical protein DUI87_08417 [Hirundo rustica rustica]|uniref:Uncharacterized protein n=1 Tax=Hirundo rustica rustica TaxID=333673 RepID=A0A3M0KSR8_HIRRU|nr:hypothetical protein DUI87_08417 [Hirundo rustica rustica]